MFIHVTLQKTSNREKNTRHFKQLSLKSSPTDADKYALMGSFFNYESSFIEFFFIMAPNHSRKAFFMFPVRWMDAVREIDVRNKMKIARRENTARLQTLRGASL